MAGRRSHHDDLRTAALDEAARMLEASGVEGLSLRALAERLAVTSPALYHHFRDKNDLLDALALRGFAALDAAVTPDPTIRALPRSERLAHFVRAYLGHAEAQPEMYDLLFGRTLWKLGDPSPALRAATAVLFRKFVDHVSEEVRRARLADDVDVVAVAQSTWAMVHGLCRQHLDGLYVHGRSLAAHTDEVVLFLEGRLVRRRAARRGAPAAPAPRTARRRIAR